MGMSIKEVLASEGWSKFRNLTRPRKRPIGGVCAALGRATPFAAWMWRVLFCGAFFWWGTGVLAYLILWICIPSEKQTGNRSWER